MSLHRQTSPTETGFLIKLDDAHLANFKTYKGEGLIKTQFLRASNPNNELIATLNFSQVRLIRPSELPILGSKNVQF